MTDATAIAPHKYPIEQLAGWFGDFIQRATMSTGQVAAHTVLCVEGDEVEILRQIHSTLKFNEVNQVVIRKAYVKHRETRRA